MRWDEDAWLLLLLLLLTLRKRLGIIGTSGWEARRMVESGEDVKVEVEFEDTEEGARVGE